MPRPNEETMSIPLKLVRPTDLVHRVQELYDSVARRAYEIFDRKGRTCGRDLENWLQAESELLHPVHVDVAESDEGLTVRAEVPGFRVENLKVGVEARRLTIAGKREAEEERRGEKTIYKEYCSNEFLRVIDLPAEVVVGKAAATLRDGVLQLNMPKAAPSTIGAGERQSQGQRKRRRRLLGGNNMFAPRFPARRSPRTDVRIPTTITVSDATGRS